METGIMNEIVKNKKKKGNSKSDKIFHICAYVIYAIFALICVYPFYYLLICTISDSQLVEQGVVFLYPVGIQFTNYIKVFRVQNLLNSLGVSVLRTVLGTGLSMLVTSYVAYFFTKEEMWGRKIWYRFTIATMYFSAGMIPIYLNMRMLHLTNTFWIYIIPGLLGVYNMVLVKTSIEALPKDLEESAVLDGAGYMVRFFRIVLPLQKAILATIGLFNAVNHWNDFFTTKLYIVKPKLYTLQFLLYELMNQVTSAANQIGDQDRYMQITPTGIRLTLTAITVIPIMLVYPFIQKYYVQGIMVGAVKG